MLHPPNHLKENFKMKVRYIIMTVTLLLTACILADMFINDFSMITIYAGSTIVVCVVYLTIDALILNASRNKRGKEKDKHSN